jgi:hypothetical protein
MYFSPEMAYVLMLCQKWVKNPAIPGNVFVRDLIEKVINLNGLFYCNSGD